MSNQCHHGHRLGQCGICALERRIAELYNALDTIYERVLVEGADLDGDELDQIQSALDAQTKLGGTVD